MARVRVGCRTVEVDELGFLSDHGQWTPEVAEALAARNSMGPLSDDHWRVLTCVRDYYLDDCNVAPPMRWVSKRTGLGEQRLRELFPRGCRGMMCKLAGLPEPSG